ncbi:hypothetical protein Esti_002630 [Eimeria stiedai]
MAAARPLPLLGAAPATAAAPRFKLCSSCCCFSRLSSHCSRAAEAQERPKWRAVSSQRQQQQQLRCRAGANADRPSHAHAREAAAAAGVGGDACPGAFVSFSRARKCGGLDLPSEKKHSLRNPSVFWEGDFVGPALLAAAAVTAAASAGEACKPGRQHPAAFAAVAATAADGLQLLKDPLWLATVEAAHACMQCSSSSSSRTCGGATEVLAGLGEGSAVAAAVRAAAAAAGDDSPLLRLQAALLVSQASELLHAVGASLDCSAAGTGAAAAAETGAGPAAAAAAGARALAHALDLWQLRLAASSFSVSLLTAAAVGATAWRPRACSRVSGAAAGARLQQLPAASPEGLLLLLQQLHAATDFVASLAHMHSQQQQLLLRCLWVLQQAQQLASQLVLPASATAAAAAAPEATATASAAVASPEPSAAAAAELCVLPQVPLTAQRLQQPPGHSGDSVSLAEETNSSAGGYCRRVLGRQHEAAEEGDTLFLRVSWQQLPHRLLYGRGPQARWGAPSAKHLLLTRPVFLPTVSLLSPSYREQLPDAGATPAAAAAAEAGGLLQQHAAKLLALLSARCRLQL